MDEVTSHHDRAAVLTADAKRLNAVVEGDVATLDRLFHPDLHYIHTNGTVEDKAAFLERLKAGSFYRSARGEGYDVFVKGDAAWVRGGVTMNVQFPDRPPFELKVAFVAVWLREDSAWRLHSYASAPIGTR